MSFRQYLAAGVAAAAVATMLGVSTAAAQLFGPFQPQGYYVPRAYLPPLYYGREPRYRERPAVDHLKVKSAEQLRKAAPLPPPQGPLLIAVSLDAQRLTLYDNGIAVARSPVSTGTLSHPTPTGVFSVIEKQRWHRSNLYSAAPMPFMQRITWSGVALHAGVLPGYPASHGCIRLPNDFAIRLWQATRLGARVIVTREEIAPVEIAPPRLFARTRPAAPPDANAPSAATSGAGNAAPQLALMAATEADAAVVSANDSAEVTPESLGLRLGGEQAPAEPTKVGTGRRKGASALGFMELPPPAGIHLPPMAQAKPLRPGPISVFVSRKERRLYVRKGFAPVFDAPVTIERPDEPLGTHVLTALEAKDHGADLRWTAVSLPSDAPKPTKTRPSRRVETAPNIVADATGALPPVTAVQALDRIVVPEDTAARISALMSVGASVIISDHGLGPETGLETGFIVLTR